MEEMGIYSKRCTHIGINAGLCDNKKVKFDAQNGLVGGTMGLFTGFSITSGVKVCYFVTRILFWFLLSKMREFTIRILSSRKEK